MAADVPVRAVQFIDLESGADVQIDMDGGGDGYTTIATMLDVDATMIVDENLLV